MSRAIAAALLMFGCAHEFAWQLFQPDLQGDVRMLTAWPLTAALLGLLAVICRDRIITAACIAVGIMTSTTALCSAWWLMSPWVVTPGQDQCSERLGFPMLLLSAFAAVCALSIWKGPCDVTKPS